MVESLASNLKSHVPLHCRRIPGIIQLQIYNTCDSTAKVFRNFGNMTGGNEPLDTKHGQ